MENTANDGEPRGIDAQSVESEYAIEHPVKRKQSQSPDSATAFDLFSESVRYWQDGDRKRRERFITGLGSIPSTWMITIKRKVGMPKPSMPFIRSDTKNGKGGPTAILEGSK
jgi:hypothetical protein